MRQNIALASLTLAAIGITACQDGATVADDSYSAESVCASDEAQAAIKKALFDAAVEEFDGEPLAINDLRRSARSKLDYATLEDKTESTADCSGRLKIAIPNDLQEKFDDDDELLADVTFTARIADDGAASDFAVDGLDFAVGKIVDAYSEKAKKPEPTPAATPAPKPSPRVATYKPSFNCNGSLSRVERLICTDPILARLDQQMSSYYYRALEGSQTTADRNALKQSQRNWLKGISGCDNTACVERTQRARIGYLRNNF